MAKRPPPGRCIHCLAACEELTWDHVFPEAWYPDTTPENLEKWKIPSCLPCNALHAKSEGELLVRLGLCLDPNEPTNAGIVEKALRALDPQSGRNEKDSRIRAANRDKILRQAFTGPDIRYQAIYPGFGPHPELVESDRVAITISATGIKRLAEKVVRGLIYVQDGKLVEEPYYVEVSVLNDEGAAPIREALSRFGHVYERGPGITVTRAVMPDGISAAYAIDIWDRFKTYAFLSMRDSENVT